ncbi:hypothetical protein K435DRAFT_851739 [Dendrothele bispora CBS 962.96]|uniref:Uncharacterized protein n=1 Tax=Dendrothele bispora (strain CBS 962.96) TaxID=1314807 RepID=A0A4S8MLJ4_DENBC|nr:hypothetical protein K435DRAFT_851739 [Dendrothele bispora CBS 962.96]
MVLENDRRGTEESDDEGTAVDDSAETKEIKRTQDRMFTAFNLTCSLVPGFKKAIDAPEATTDPKFVRRICNQLDSGANQGRNDDVSRAKLSIAEWLNARPNPPSPPLQGSQRIGRGFTSDVTGRLLCPIQLDWDNSHVRSFPSELLLRDDYDAIFTGF